MHISKQELYFWYGLAFLLIGSIAFQLESASSLIEAIHPTTKITIAHFFWSLSLIFFYLTWRAHVLNRLGRTEELILEQSTPAPPPLQRRTATVVRLDLYRQQATNSSRL